jgi:cholesterol transport system auxiliary component
MLPRRLLLTAPLVLTACASLLPAQNYVPRTDWPLDLAPPPATGALGGQAVLMIRPLDAAPGLDARGLQSLGADGRLKVDYYNLWAVAPNDAMTEALLEWSAASGRFAAVVSPGSRLAPGLIVEGELTELLADMGQGQARAGMTLVVIRAEGALTDTAVPLAQVRLQASVPLSGNDPESLVAAQKAALAALLAQAMALLARFA